MFGLNSNFAIAFSTFSSVRAETFGSLFTTRETVFMETPASSATVFNVTVLGRSGLWTGSCRVIRHFYRRLME